MNAKDSQWEKIFPPELRAEEAKSISIRRYRVGTSQGKVEGTTSMVALPSDTVGVALSGGGIRSATFCLGFFQALAKHGLVRRIDYLSTVSGGGYFGSFLGRWFARYDEQPLAGPGKAVDRIEDDLADCYSEPLKWLRENGRYISPNGAGDTWYALGVYLRSWVALHFVLSLLILTTFLATTMLRFVLWHHWLLWAKLETFLLQHAHPLFWWSPYIILPAITFTVALFPLGWAYWLTQTDLKNWGNLVPLINTFLVLIGSVFYIALGSYTPCLIAGKFLALTSFLTLLYWIYANLLSITQKRHARLRFTENRLSKWLATSLLMTAGLAAFALIDSLGHTFHTHIADLKKPVVAITGTSFIAGCVTLIQKLATMMQRRPKENIRLPFSTSLLLTTVALLMLTFILALWAEASHAIWWDIPCKNSLLIAFLIALALSVTSGRVMKFLNLSSQQQLYGSRLARAYLGASNPDRWETSNQADRRSATAIRSKSSHSNKSRSSGRSVSEVIDGDDLHFIQYAPHMQGGPLHLINVTVNETVDGKSQLEQRDRKGIPMAISPCGISVGRRHHALWLREGDSTSFSWIRPLGNKDEFRMLAAQGASKTCVENLNLGNWIGISGAAFSTGLGAHTNLGLSLLLGLANVRLGYWWDSGVRPCTRANRTPPDFLASVSEALSFVFSSQAHLYEELLARFHGPARQRWYLTDGGHFENTACYELLRRRVPFMIVCDNGQDPDYRFEDLAGLVRKARLDFNADIRFFTRSDIDNCLDPSLWEYIGTLQELRRVEQPSTTRAPEQESRFASSNYSEKHATLAWVHYENAEKPGSVILFVKPSVTGDERLDVLQYNESHPEFPQESTSDQSFDEAQWESYRRLGEHIGNMLFGNDKKKDATKWIPRDMSVPEWRAPVNA